MDGLSEVEPKILAVIPARGGSKRIPRKNIQPILGRPLIAYTISEALKSSLITEMVVSSEDDDIIRIAKRYGANVPFKRPIELAGDDVTTLAVLKHAVGTMEKLKGLTYAYVVLLYPTTPLKTREDIDAVIRKLMETSADSVVSITRVVTAHPLRMCKIVDDRVMSFIQNASIGMFRRQDLPPVYIRNDCAYAFHRDMLMSADDKNMFGRDVRAYIMPSERSVDINEPLDLLTAEALMKNRDWSHVKPVGSVELV